MEEFLSKLRKTYLRTFLPSIVVFAIALIVTRYTEPFVDMLMSVRIMIALLTLTLVAFVTSYFSLRSARTKTADLKGEQRYDIYARAYNTRIMVMSILSALSSIAYVITKDSNDIYLVVIITLLVLLYYPSEAFISKQLGD